MAPKKKQHFVPQFYLRNFSWADRKQINIFNLPSQRNILHGRLKDQCQDDYFYGKDGKLEDAMGGLESPSAPIFQNIIDTQSLPAYHSEEHRLLLAFMLIQNSRTKFAKEEQSELAENVANTAKDMYPQMDDKNVRQVRESVKIPFHVAISESARLIPIVDDLKQVLLINESGEVFITSDNPVILYNLYLEKSKLHSNIGWASLGLQAFLPLSPKILLHLYDGNIYKVGQKPPQEKIVIKDVNDINELNRLQFLNTLQNIYYSDDNQQQYVESEGRKILARRKQDKVDVKQGYIVNAPDPEQNKLIYTFKRNIKNDLRLTFIKVRRTKRKVSIEGRERQLRNPELVQLFEIFSKKIDGQRYKQGDFYKFLGDLKSGRVKI